MSNLWAKHLILVGYSVGLNLNHSTELTKWKIGERIASTALIFYKYPYINKKTFLLKNSFNCESSNLICCYLPRMQRRTYRRNWLSSERVNKYLQTVYKTASTSAISSWRTFTYLWRRKVPYVSFFSRLLKKINH